MLKKIIISFGLHILWFGIMTICILMTYSLNCPAVCEFIASDHPVLSMIIFTVIINLIIMWMCKVNPFRTNQEKNKFIIITCMFTALMWVPFIIPILIIFVSYVNL